MPHCLLNRQIIIATFNLGILVDALYEAMSLVSIKSSLHMIAPCIPSLISNDEGHILNLGTSHDRMLHNLPCHLQCINKKGKF